MTRTFLFKSFGSTSAQDCASSLEHELSYGELGTVNVAAWKIQVSAGQGMQKNLENHRVSADNFLYCNFLKWYIADKFADNSSLSYATADKFADKKLQKPYRNHQFKQRGQFFAADNSSLRVNTRTKKDKKGQFADNWIQAFGAIFFPCPRQFLCGGYSSHTSSLCQSTWPPVLQHSLRQRLQVVYSHLRFQGCGHCSKLEARTWAEI